MLVARVCTLGLKVSDMLIPETLWLASLLSWLR